MVLYIGIYPVSFVCIGHALYTCVSGAKKSVGLIGFFSYYPHSGLGQTFGPLQVVYICWPLSVPITSATVMILNLSVITPLTGFLNEVSDCFTSSTVHLSMFSTFEVDVEAGYVQYICMCMAVPACVDARAGPHMTQEYVHCMCMYHCT